MAHSKTTSKRVASKASNLLRNSNNSRVKSVAGSALTQKHKGRR